MMSLKDVKNKLLGRFFPKEGDASRRPDGGTSCYRPIRRKTPEENQAQPEQAPEQQPMTYIHTGFTGMNPPADGYAGMNPPSASVFAGMTPPPAVYDTGFGLDGYGRSAQGMYAQGGQPAWNPGAYTQPQQPSWNPGAYTQPQQPSWNPGTNYAAPAAEAPAARGRGRVRTEDPPATAARPERGWFPPREEMAAPSNISYMPGYAPDAGAAPFNHVEHIMAMTGLKSCYEAIECMKNGETLIVELDAIANDNESMRCQDMLAGAAFTLGCSVRMLQGGRLVLIAPDGVKILPEENVNRPVMAPPAYAQPMPAAEQAPRQRERRSGRNAADWKAARSGQMDNYNPYTGTMPAAAGAYGSFGGYGY